MYASRLFTTMPLAEGVETQYQYGKLLEYQKNIFGSDLTCHGCADNIYMEGKVGTWDSPEIKAFFPTKLTVGASIKQPI